MHALAIPLMASSDAASRICMGAHATSPALHGGWLHVQACLSRRLRGPAASAPAPQILRFKEAAASNFTTASFEGSTHYVLESRWLAGQLRDLFPWLRIGGWQYDGAGDAAEHGSMVCRCGLLLCSPGCRDGDVWGSTAGCGPCFCQLASKV